MALRTLITTIIVAICAIFGVICVADDIVPAATLAPSPYHRWAHEHWVWNHNSMSDQADVEQLMDDYAAHDIKFGGVNIDSTWATQYNNFEVNSEKFSDFQGLVSSIHKAGKRVILWATSFVNVENPDFQEAADKKYLVRDKFGKARPLKWWHGEGALVDYTNPEAVKWWHSLMDRVLKLGDGDGVDGFKCDASDPYILEYMVAGEALGYNDVPYEGYHQYADLYYGDFFNYTREVRGEAGLIMSRPVDCVLRDKVARVCLGQSPKFVMTSGWVGDDNADMRGLRGCARKVIYSAWDGYGSYGCDIGGYRAQQLSPEDTKEYFLRSAQLNAFLPLMENGGAGEHRPWMINGGDDEITAVYRDLVNHHTRLAPLHLTLGSYALEKQTSVIKPLAKNEKSPHARDGYRPYAEPKTFAYTIGNDILVHPVLSGLMAHENETLASVVDIEFPGDASVTWLDWFNPAVSKFAQTGGSSLRRLVPVSEIPVYVRKNAMMPLLEESTVTFTWFAPEYSTDTLKAEMREPAEAGPGLVAEGVWTSKSSVQVSISAHGGPVALSLPAVAKPSKVSVSEGVPCVDTYTLHSQTLNILCDDNSRGVVMTVIF